MQGSCLCGQVSFEIEGEMRPPIACHCTQCRKTSGHFWAATQVPTERLRMTREDGLAWFVSSDHARRGFCKTCGSSLFWEMQSEGMISISAGTLDGPTGLVQSKHIFVEDKGDYYTIGDDLPQIDRY